MDIRLWYIMRENVITRVKQASKSLSSWLHSITTTTRHILRTRRTVGGINVTFPHYLCCSWGDGISSQYIYQDSKLLASLMQWKICFLPGWSGKEIKCTMHVALPKRPMNQFNLVPQSRQQVLTAYYSNLYTVHQLEELLRFDVRPFQFSLVLPSTAPSLRF